MEHRIFHKALYYEVFQVSFFFFFNTHKRIKAGIIYKMLPKIKKNNLGRFLFTKMTNITGNILTY